MSTTTLICYHNYYTLRNVLVTFRVMNDKHTCMLMSPNKEVKLLLLLVVVGGATLLLLVTDSPSNIPAVDCC